MSEAVEPACVTDRLRAAWKPHKRRLAENDPRNPTNIRVHRALSWLDAAEDPCLGETADDERLLFRWIAFNALYSRWDAQRLEPCGDQASFRAFLGEVLALDAGGAVGTLLREHKPLVLTLLDNSFLSRSFWKDPSIERSQRWSRKRQDAQQLFAREDWGSLLEAAFEPVYFLRCQLVHGASTRGSSMNRASLRHGNALLALAVPVLLAVVIDHGMDADWGPLCYPPQD